MLIIRGLKMSKTKTKAGRQNIGSAFDLLEKSLDIVKKNWQAFAVVNVFAILSALDQAFNRRDVSGWDKSTWSGLSGIQLASILGLSFLAVLVFVAIEFFFATMMVSLHVKSTAGKKPSVSDLFEDGKKYFFRLLGLVILMGLLIAGGLVLFIVPGIIAIGRVALAPFYLIDKNVSIMEALKMSNEKAKGNMGPVYSAIGVTILIAIVSGFIGIVPLIGPIVGVGITIAYSLVLALRYQQLKKI